jgi:cytosine/adenosine deaminase-related metal-dependent hydrolase
MNRLADMGTVEQGKLADLVLLDANPIDDIDNTRKIRAVVLAGRYLDRAALDRMLHGVEVAAAAERGPPVKQGAGK